MFVKVLAFQTHRAFLAVQAFFYFLYGKLQVSALNKKLILCACKLQTAKRYLTSRLSATFFFNFPNF